MSKTFGTWSKLGLDGGPEVVRRPSAAEDEPAVRRALAVDDQVPVVGERRAPGQADLVPHAVRQRLGRHDQRVHGHHVASHPRERHGVALRRPDHDVGPNRAVAGDHAPGLDDPRRRLLVDRAPRAARPPRPGREPGGPGAPRHSAVCTCRPARPGRVHPGPGLVRVEEPDVVLAKTPGTGRVDLVPRTAKLARCCGPRRPSRPLRGCAVDALLGQRRPGPRRWSPAWPGAGRGRRRGSSRGGRRAWPGGWEERRAPAAVAT